MLFFTRGRNQNVRHVFSSLRFHNLLLLCTIWNHDCKQCLYEGCVIDHNCGEMGFNKSLKATFDVPFIKLHLLQIWVSVNKKVVYRTDSADLIFQCAASTFVFVKSKHFLLAQEDSSYCNDISVFFAIYTRSFPRYLSLPKSGGSSNQYPWQTVNWEYLASIFYRNLI